MNRTINLQDHLKELVTKGRSLAYQLEIDSSEKIIHDLRVCVRRLRTVTALVGDEIPKKERDQLKKIWRLLSKVRDHDVIQELARKYSVDESQDKEKRSHAGKKLRDQFADKKTHKLLDEMEKLPSLKVDPLPLVRELRTRIIRNPSGPEHLHELRIILKKIRYLAEALGFDVGLFKEVQDVLGEFHDVKVFLEKHPDSLDIRRAEKKAKEKAIAIARSAFQLGLNTLGEIENAIEQEMMFRAS